MSGMTKIPFSSRIASASAVVGPFAPSQMTFARMREAWLDADETRGWTRGKAVPFGDFLIHSHRYGIVLEGPDAGKIVVDWGAATSEVIAISLADFWGRYLVSPEDLFMFDRPKTAGA